MYCKGTSSSDKEGEYSALEEVLNRYLTGERPIDDVLEHPDFRREVRGMCNGIAGNADRGEELFQSFCLGLLRKERRAGGLRATLKAAGLHRLDGWRAYLYRSAKHLACSKWRDKKRREELAPTYHLTPDDVRRLRARDVSPEVRCMLGEALTIIAALPEKKRLAFDHWLRGRTAREIEEILNGAGFPCTHVVVQTWIKDVLSELRGYRVNSIKKAS